MFTNNNSNNDNSYMLWGGRGPPLGSSMNFRT